MTLNEKVAIALLKKAIQLKRAGILCLIAGAMSACAGFGVKMEGYRIDELQSAQKTYPKPISCLWKACPEWDTQNAGGK